MNLPHDALRDLTALTELKSDGGILERQFLQLKEHVIKGHLVGTSSLEGMRMSLQLRRIGGISEEEHAADVDGKVAEILNNSDCVEGWRLCNTGCTNPSVCLEKEGQTPCRQVRIRSRQQASQPRRRGKGAGCGKHLGRQHHKLLGQSYRQAGEMCYVLYPYCMILGRVGSSCGGDHFSRHREADLEGGEEGL